ncbi:MAG: hypothetical protein GOVbin140_100 [Prokaryotic dsDNA virus sp.]|nr:MAG: hypothetical protein GOVbin140_100 [Prokaryotic dsDNA virus sp.]
MWFETLKSKSPLSIVDNLELNLFSGAVDNIIDHYEKDTTNIVAMRNKAKDISEGNISPELKAKTNEMVQAGAKLYEFLIEKEKEKRARPQKDKSVTNILEKIVNESDEEALINYVGAGYKSWRGTLREEKKNALLQKKDEIISKFITNKKLFGVNLTDYSRTITKEITDEQREKLNSYLSSKELKVEGEKIVYPEAMEYESFKNIDSYLAGMITNRDKEDLDNIPPIFYLETSKEGKAIKSYLLKLYNLDIEDSTIDRLPKDIQKYKPNINNNLDVTRYLTIIAGDQYKKSNKFVPIPTIKSGTATTVARDKLLTVRGTSMLHPTLRALLGSSRLDISTILQIGQEQQKVRFLPVSLRMLMEGQIEKPDVIDDKDLENLIDEYNDSTDYSRFINSAQKEYSKQIRQLIDYYSTPIPTFTEKEKELISSFVSEGFDENEVEPEETIQSALEEFYQKEIDGETIRDKIIPILEKVDIDNIFVDARGKLKFKPIKGVNTAEQTEFVNLFRNLRMKEEEVKIEISEQEEIDELLELKKLKTNYVPEYNEINLANIFYYLYYIDMLYAKTGFKRQLISYWRTPLDDDGEFSDEEKENLQNIINYAKENYVAIMDSMKEPIANKIQDILDNPVDYQKLITSGRGVNIIQNLRKNQLIVEE